MRIEKTLWASPSEFLQVHQPDLPVVFFSPAALQAKAARFSQGFPGLVTYAVKSNPDEVVLSNLVAAGINAFDVASPVEMDLVARVAPNAVMHYNNPVRSVTEIAHAVALGVKSYSVDSLSELDKLVAQVPAAGCEIAVRFKLPVKGAAYDFGEKFGADKVAAGVLLGRVKSFGYTPSLTFHPGTQCHDPAVWDAYIRAAAEIAAGAGVRISRLNVGGGFPSHRLAAAEPALEQIFALIERVTEEAFGDDVPRLLCEPGRGMVGDSFSLATRVKAIRDGVHVFLNDGLYGGLAEHPVVGPIDRIDVIAADRRVMSGDLCPRVVFGPTCDSLDCLPEEVNLPDDLAEGDYVIFHGLGAYSASLATRFNGYGNLSVETVAELML